MKTGRKTTGVGAEDKGNSESTSPVSDSPTPVEQKIAELPSWLQHEIVTPAPDGTRSNHCIKIAPSLLREGLSPDEVLALLYRLYPHAGKELEGLVARAEVYAQTERESDPEYLVKRDQAEAKTNAARAALPRIIEEWPMEDLDTDLPDLSLDAQRRAFLLAMFQPEDVVWIGEKQHSGPNFKHHFKTVREWLGKRRGGIHGEFVSHCVFKPGTTSRNMESMAGDKYLVLESDVLQPGELAAVARYMRDFHGLPLYAIVTTGGKRHAPEPGLHFWFKHPGTSTLDGWKAVLLGYGADVSTLRGPQPVRLPGCIRQNTKLPQQLLWIAPFLRR